MIELNTPIYRKGILLVRKYLSVMLIVLLMSGESSALLPATYKDYKARYQSEARTPEGAVKMYFDAVFAFINEQTRDEAAKMLRYSMHSETPIERSAYYSTFVERMKSSHYSHIFRSFAVGTSPENNYAMSPDDYELAFTGERRQDSGYVTVFLKSSGADSVRGVWVKQYDDGLWYVINNASTYVEVRQPKRQNAHDADYDLR